MKNNIIAIIVAVALVVGAGGFFAGMKYQQSKSPTGRFANFQGARMGNFAQGTQGFRPVNGEIIGSDDKIITVKLSDGSSKIVLLSDNTAITEATSAAKESLAVGKQVMVLGSNNSDGSVTAQNIQLNPQGFRGSHPGGNSGGSPR
ncbi:hypothetical protein HYU93_00390 [Candidatus Daviesbacteria bacterium]|nr:hypothetical protein [Candidatus Daviesbacteria bacterium]